MFTTAGSTRVTILENEDADGTGSGTASGVAFVPANEKPFIAETCPDTTEPIRTPTPNVSATKKVASTLRRRAQSNISFTCCPIFPAPQFARNVPPASLQYTIANPAEFLAANRALVSPLAGGPVAERSSDRELRVACISSIPLYLTHQPVNLLSRTFACALRCRPYSPTYLVLTFYAFSSIKEPAAVAATRGDLGQLAPRKKLLKS